MDYLINKESQYLRSLIEASPDPMIVFNTDGKITDLNLAQVNITGLKSEKLIGADFFQYFTEPKKAKEVCNHVFASGSVIDAPLTFRHVSGKLTDVSINGSVYLDEKGSVAGAVVMARDISEQKWATELRIANKELVFQNEEKEKRAAELIIANKELVFQNEEKEKRAAELITANKELAYQNTEKEKRAEELIIANKELEFQNKEKAKRAAELIIANYARGLIEASLDPLVTINNLGKIMDMNEALSNITGMSREELTGSDFFDYFTEPQKAREVYQEVFARGSVADFPLTLRNREGMLTSVLFNGSVYKDDLGNVLGVVIVARDVTERNKAEKELTEAIVSAELATSIAEEEKKHAEGATKTAENAVKAKQQFLSNMSHEIRTPMNAIIGFTKVLLKTDITPRQKEYLTAIKLSGDSLIVLINDILDLAKVDAGKMVFQQIPFKLAISISAMLHLFEPKIREKNLELVKEYDPQIPDVLAGDPVRLHQIILNLVSNAVKFTVKGRIKMCVKMVDEDEEKVTIEFSVSDTGIGIPANKVDKVFENFHQATSDTARLYGGTGLGLAISKQLVESQGGTIKVVSKAGEGSVFSFRLPFLKTEKDAYAEHEPVELDTDIKGIRVLVVEDIVLNQLLMKTLLDDFGFEQEIAGNGKIAIEKLKEGKYDIVLMDLQMPVMNGFDATEYIRNDMQSDIPIIALTADVTTVDLAKCKAVGMNDYLSKPIDERVLYRKIIDWYKKQIPVKETGIKYVDLTYLNKRTKSNPELMMQMISLYLEQTPLLISQMKKGVAENDVSSLKSSAHKLIPSFMIVGISKDYETMARKIQEYAGIVEYSEELSEMVKQLDIVCTSACEELKEEYKLINKLIK